MCHKSTLFISRLLYYRKCSRFILTKVYSHRKWSTVWQNKGAQCRSKRHRNWSKRQELNKQLEVFQHGIDYTKSMNALMLLNDTWALVSCLVHGDQKEGRGKRWEKTSSWRFSTDGPVRYANYWLNKRSLVIWSTMHTNGKRCSFEDEVQEELGMKLWHTPKRLKLLLSVCVHMQQVYMTGDSRYHFLFHMIFSYSWFICP